MNNTFRYSNDVSWDDIYMSMAYLIAMKSKDARTHLGAVIVGPDNEVRSTGLNGFPRGINDNLPERQESPEKYFWFAHAERNAIYNAAHMGLSTRDCKMYTNGVPCADCCIAIIQSGIREVIVDMDWNDNNSDKWADSAKRSFQMFKEAGVEVRFWTGELIDIYKFRRGSVYKQFK